MTTTATETQHQPWCTEHVDPNPQEGVSGWCVAKSVTHGVEADLASGVDSLNGGSGIEIYASGQDVITAAQAREVALALVRASLVLEGCSGSSLAVATNLVRIVCERQPMDVNVVEYLANALEVSVTELLTD